MRIYQSLLGTVRIAPVRDLFQYAWETIQETAAQEGDHHKIVALTGGSTPKAFYQWVREHAALQGKTDKVWWTTSDERFVPLSSEESNQGNGWRELCAPLKVKQEQMLFWETENIDPQLAAQRYAQRVSDKVGDSRAYQLCFLGMGDDGHTASLFPGSELFANEPDSLFCAVDVPGKGQRLTITPKGLEACDQIVIMVSGKGKAARLKEVMAGTDDLNALPVRLLGRFPTKVTWLIDLEAAAEL